MRHALSSCLATALLASCCASAAEPDRDAEATLSFVSADAALVGNAFGINYIDSDARVLDQRIDTRLASGLHTVWYACPDEQAPKDGSRMSFVFEAGKHYQLVCRAGLEATIRETDNC